LLSLTGAALGADDPCDAFTWNVTHERQLFSQDPQTLPAGRTPAAAPALGLDRLYELELSAQPEITFAVPPGKKWPKEATYAGLATLTVPTAGSYRISLDQAAWIDVVANGAPLTARDFQGRPGCSAPHKIVEFALPASTPLTIQFSGGVVSLLRVTLTRAPAPAAKAAH
jgi:hypothetical protein